MKEIQTGSQTITFVVYFAVYYLFIKHSSAHNRMALCKMAWFKYGVTIASGHWQLLILEDLESYFNTVHEE